MASLLGGWLPHPFETEGIGTGSIVHGVVERLYVPVTFSTLNSLTRRFNHNNNNNNNKSRRVSMAKKKKGGKQDARGYATTTTTTKSSIATPGATLPDRSAVARLSVPNSLVAPESAVLRPLLSSTTTSLSLSSFLQSNNNNSHNLVITPSIYAILEELLVLLEKYDYAATTGPNNTNKDSMPDNTNNTALILLSPVVLRKRVGTTYDALTACGFTLDQIRAAARAGVLVTSASSSAVPALDWLCWHLPTLELPTLFAEPLVRTTEAAMQEAPRGPILSVIRPSMAAAADEASTQDDCVGSGIQDRTLQQRTQDIDASWSAILPSKDHANLGDDNGQQQQQQQDAKEKAWLLDRYQYEEEEDSANNCREEEEEERNELVGDNEPSNGTEELAEGSCHHQPFHGEQNASPETIIDTPIDGKEFISETMERLAITETSHTSEILPSSIRSADEDMLLTLQTELSALELDANNDANNYMRSKQEIKELKQNLKSLRKRVAGQENKVARQKAAVLAKETFEANATDRENGDPGGTLAVDSNPTEDEDGIFLSLFSMNDDGESNNQTNKSTTKNVQDAAPVADIPKDSIPASWTGKTPRVYLEEWCRKEKASKPIYDKLPMHGCRLLLKKLINHGDSLSVEEKGPHQSYADVQHFVATKALYQLHSTLPLYRLFPPFYRDLWLKWLENERNDLTLQRTAADDQRRDLVNDLISCMSPTSSSLPNQSGGIEEETGKNVARSASTRNSRVQRESNKPFYNGNKLKEQFIRRRDSPNFKRMLESRRNLPIYSYKDEILDKIEQYPVTILCAETGSGKTTQCSSFILEHALEQGKGDTTSILCTQPRRVAAVSVAERVADELADASIGKGYVGYQIRMEARRCSETRILFCTTGVILRRLIEDPTLTGISHVVVDEVHERQWQIDVLLVVLRNMINNSRPDLKVVLMSATLDQKLFGTFFRGAPIVNVPGRTFPVSTYYLEDLLEFSGHIIESGSRCAFQDWSRRKTVSMFVTSRGGEKRKETADYEMSDEVSNDYPGYSLATRKSMDRVDESVINYDLIEDVLSILLLNDECPFTLPASFKLEKQSDNTHSTNGAVLIFMPGIGEIRTLIDRLVGMRSFGNSNKFEIIPLHSTLSSTDQKRAFKTSTIGCRKIIVSTNVAETSVTIPDVVYVLDCGRVREIRRNKRTSTKTLIATWCSRASAKQRAGRAGRVQSGICLKLYSSKTERTVMMQSSEPELKRIPLEEICLTILAGHFATDCLGFLSLTPEPPDDLAVNAALKVLEDIGAVVVDRTLSNTHLVSSAQVLTDLGRHLSKLPVDARVGKMLLFGAVFKCTDAVLTIAASLSASKSPFVNSFEDGPQAKAAHKPFYHPFSDFLTLVNVWKAFRQADQSGNARQFCREKYLNFAVLREIQDARYHFLDLLCGLGLISREVLGDCVGKVSLEQKLVTSDYCLYDSIEQVVHAVIYAGLNPNVASLSWGVRPDDLRAIHKNEQLIIQSSVNSKASRLAPSSWLTFFEKFGTEKRVTISTTAFVSPFCLLLFGSEVQVLHLERKVIVDNWIIVSLAAKTGIMIREIRNRLQNLLSSLFNESNMADPHRDDSVLEAIVKLLLKG